MRRLLSITGALSNGMRLRAVLAIKNRELCLRQISYILGLAQSTVSKHMTVLQDAGLVVLRKEGKWHYYRLVEVNCSGAAGKILQCVLKELGNDPTVKGDSRRIREVRNRHFIGGQ